MMRQGKQSSSHRGWLAHLWHEWFFELRRPIAPAAARPRPNEWPNDRLIAAWLGHSTVLLNFYGVTILTDPVLFPRIGIRLPFSTIGPKRLTKPALTVRELPPIDLILLSHAHFDHLDTRTLHRFGRRTQVMTASRTSDLLRWMRMRDVTEMAWGEKRTVEAPRGDLVVRAFRVRHWGARLRYDNYRGYNGYVIEREGRRIVFAGDTALTNDFETLRDGRPFDLAIIGIGAYQPWIHSHCTPEQAIAMADAAGARHIMPVHHQTFKLSFEPFREPIERFTGALQNESERIALREIGETFVLPEGRAAARPECDLDPETGRVEPRTSGS
ncbi:MAG: MBL fold metallo-hydrolase [Chthoniobacterales bacterium]|nr:MBL fold metallo-hydrolase [Chthoniobacterales bacterium]